MSEDNPFPLDLTQVENLGTSLRNMSMKSMNFWVFKFVQEHTDKDGDPYTEKTIYQIVCSLRRYLEEHGRVEANISTVKNYW